jgi:hypothetical protein
LGRFSKKKFKKVPKRLKKEKKKFKKLDFQKKSKKLVVRVGVRVRG